MSELPGVGMTEQTEGAEVTRFPIDAIYDLLVDHPMWINDDGDPLDYLPERESRIADFMHGVDHILETAKAAAEVRGAQAVLAAVEAIHVPIHDKVCAACRVLVLPCPTLTAARGAAAVTTSSAKSSDLATRVPQDESQRAAGAGA